MKEHSNISILIIEDESQEALRTESLIYSLGYKVLGCYDNAKDGIKNIREKRPDALVVDINIKGNRNGIELVEEVKDLSIPVIFTTGLQEKDIFKKAQETQPVAYLVKPFNKLTFQSALENALFNRTESSLSDDNKNDLTQEVWLKDSFFIKRNNLLQKVKIDDINYIQSEGNYCDIFSDKKHVVKMSLTQILRKLPQDRFLRIHQRYVVHLDKINTIDINHNEIHIGKNEIPIGPSFKDQVFKHLNRLM